KIMLQHCVVIKHNKKQHETKERHSFLTNSKQTDAFLVFIIQLKRVLFKYL
ncbi:hypothetical protein DOY81_004042, partial [Sarcophaga bullata]